MSFCSYEGQRALVTGAGSATGIGFRTARLLGELGASVVLAATSERIHDRAGELRDAGIDATGIVGDLTDAGEVARLAAVAGPLDVLVNNAGMTSVTTGGEEGSLLETEPTTWRASISRNLDTCYLVTRACLPAMTARSYGRVVNVTSVTGPVVAYAGDVAYAAAKAGMVGLTRAVAMEVAGQGVTVNAVAPGWIDTASQTDWERDLGLTTPVGRSGQPDEVAAAIAFLAAREAAYVTGVVLVVDGGNSVLEGRRG